MDIAALWDVKWLGAHRCIAVVAEGVSGERWALLMHGAELVAHLLRVVVPGVRIVVPLLLHLHLVVDIGGVDVLVTVEVRVVVLESLLLAAAVHTEEDTTEEHDHHEHRNRDSDTDGGRHVVVSWLLTLLFGAGALCRISR